MHIVIACGSGRSFETSSEKVNKELLPSSEASQHATTMSSVASVEIDVSKCPVSGVVVYLDRADVTRSVEVELNPGENEVIVKQLSSAIDSDSIRYVEE